MTSIHELDITSTYLARAVRAVDDLICKLAPSSVHFHARGDICSSLRLQSRAPDTLTFISEASTLRHRGRPF